MSPWIAAGPVTWAVSPSGSPDAKVSRVAVTASATSVESVEGTETMPSAALPSSLTTRGARLAPGTVCSRVVTVRSSAGESSPEEEVNSTTATVESASGRRSCSWAAAAVSLSIGRLSTAAAVCVAGPTRAITAPAASSANAAIAPDHRGAVRCRASQVIVAPVRSLGGLLSRSLSR